MKTILWQHLNWLDYTILGIIALSIIISFFRGFIREAVSLIVWVFAIVLGLKFATPLGLEFKSFIPSDTFRYVVAFAIIVIVVLLVGVIINFFVKKIIDKIGISAIDRILGLFFGAARGIFAVSVIILFINLSAFKEQAWYQSSQLSPKFMPIVVWLESFLPKKMQQVSAWVHDREPSLPG